MHSNHNHLYTETMSRQHCRNVIASIKELSDQQTDLCHGYWRVPNPKKHIEWCDGIDKGLHPGNCFEVNSALFHKMKSTGDYPGLRLVSVYLKNKIDHCFILDGDIIYDNSQFQERKMCARMYETTNVALMVSSWTDPPPAQTIRDLAQEGSYHGRGPLTYTDSTYQQAMKTIINL
jgi:hypothetical protein